MSLTSFLLGKSKEVDTELDALFKSAPRPQKSGPTATPPASNQHKKSNKRKLVEEGPVEVISTISTKRVKSIPSPTKVEKKAEKKNSSRDKPEKDTSSDKIKPKKKKKKTVYESNQDEDDDEEDNNSDLENRYLVGTTAKSTTPSKSKKAQDIQLKDGGSGLDSDSDALVTPGETPVHESLQKKRKSFRSAGKQKYVPAEETPEQRDRRTIFVGNLPIAMAQERPLRKKLQRHILNFVPSARIESVRFRSIPFRTPTAKLPTSDNEGDATPKQNSASSKNVSNLASSSQPRRQHDVDRATSWRSKLDEKDEELVKKDDKMFLNTNQKKKIAFINHELHTAADTVNAYVVFAHPTIQENRPTNLPPLPETMDPYEAAKLAVQLCNGTMFMERFLRIDRVGKAGKGNSLVGHESGEGGQKEQGVGALLDADPKLSIFVGNLEFGSKEEDLRVFFEGVIIAERGTPVGEDDDEIKVDGETVAPIKKLKTWVTGVRIVRDKDTQLGKGFAYVQFADRECVDEVLALGEDKLKFAKRKLRVQRCKSLPGSSLKINTSTSKKSGPGQPKAPATTLNITVPRGDPNFGEKLAHLSKDARKEVKASDADRVARRLAKKKARMAMPHGLGGGKGKDRERLRKGGSKAKADRVNPGRKTSKGRVRSDKSAAKRNMKK